MAISAKETKRKSQKLFPLVKIGAKYGGVPDTIGWMDTVSVMAALPFSFCLIIRWSSSPIGKNLLFQAAKLFFSV